MARMSLLNEFVAVPLILLGYRLYFKCSHKFPFYQCTLGFWSSIRKKAVCVRSCTVQCTVAVLLAEGWSTTRGTEVGDVMVLQQRSSRQPESSVMGSVKGIFQENFREKSWGVCMLYLSLVLTEGQVQFPANV